MKKEDFSFAGHGGKELHGTRYHPESPAGALGIIHGMAEHGKRYDEFARDLTEKDYSVYVYDQRGHGETAIKNGDSLGHIGPEEGWESLLKDSSRFLEEIKVDDGTPLYLFGHSMGSFIARHLIAEEGEKIEGAIFSGTGKINSLVMRLVHPAAKVERWLLGKDKESYLMEKLLFSSNNAEFEPADTPFDWLSRDLEAVKDYVNDELSGFSCTTGFYETFIHGMKQLASIEEGKEVPEDLSVLFISGEKDPVGGREVAKLAETYSRAGVEDVGYRIYEGARHELINEINRDEVIHDLISWLEDV